MTRLTYAGFKEWLESFRPQQIVGIHRNSECCPLANFIEQPLVWYHGFPRWAEDFTWEIDRHRRRKCITAARALKILEGIR